MFSATEKIIRVDDAESKVRVGDCHLLAAGVVTDRPRAGARTARSNQEAAGFRLHQRDSAAAGADGLDIDNWLQHAKTLDDGFLGIAPITFGDKAYVEACPAHVGGDDILMLEEAGDVSGSDHPARRTRLQIGDGAHMLAMGDAAVPLHDQQRSFEPAALELRFQSFYVAFDGRSQVAIKDGGVRAGVFTGYLRNRTAEGPVHFSMRVRLGGEGANFLFVFRIRPGVHETDAHGFDFIFLDW